MLTISYALLGAVFSGVVILLAVDLTSTFGMEVSSLAIHFLIGIGSGLTFAKLYKQLKLRGH